MVLEVCFEKRKNIRFTHKSILIGEKGHEGYRVILLLENKKTGVKVPHPLTEFFSKYNNLEHSSIVQKANYIVPFLNYTFNNNNSYRLRSLSEITFQHGVDFLNEFSTGKIGRSCPNRDTVKSAERVLTQFYEFMLEKGLLSNSEEMILSTGQFYHQIRGVMIYKKSPFRGVIYPRNKRKNKLTSIPMELIKEFLDLAILETPDIALGIYFQLFGGLRMSEVINLSKNSIELIGFNAQNGMNIDVRERYFRKDIINNNGKWGVKKPRNQYVIPVDGLLSKLYARHMDTYHKGNCHQALFINKNNEAMSGSSYYDKFLRLKKAFIKNLSDNENPRLKAFAIVLLSKKWSTHICRGTFSKLVADYSKNPTELAVLRGDSSYESVFPYIQGSFGVEEVIKNVMRSFYENLLVEE